MKTSHEASRTDPEYIADVVRSFREESDRRHPDQVRNIPVRHEGRKANISVRGRRALVALAITPVLLYAGNRVVDSFSENEPYTGPVHVTQNKDGSRVVEGIYDTQKGDDLTKIAKKINELGHVKNAESEEAIAITHEHLREHGGGLRDDGTSIPIQSASQLSSDQDVLVRNFSVDPQGEIHIDPTGLNPEG